MHLQVIYTFLEDLNVEGEPHHFLAVVDVWFWVVRYYMGHFWLVVRRAANFPPGSYTTPAWSDARMCWLVG